MQIAPFVFAKDDCQFDKLQPDSPPSSTTLLSLVVPFYIEEETNRHFFAAVRLILEASSKLRSVPFPYGSTVPAPLVAGQAV
jgi:hypothetical protein